ncbi:MAG TPA: hypothetical protein VFM05_02680 [Candidatus Saccharimonadales bacterium]|nr:hypothetical protein [Candidatus Saccharimonadales bacterium]
MRKYLVLSILIIFVGAGIFAVTGLRQPTAITAQDSESANRVSEEIGRKAIPDDDDTFTEEGLPKHTDRYDNYVYYFSIVIPPGLVGYSAPDPAPAHGVAVPLSKNPDTWVYAGAHYNASFLESLDEALDQHLEWIKGRGTDIEVIRREHTFIQRLPAMRFAVRYKSKTSGRIKIEDQVIAFRPDREANTDMIYEATLYTTEDHYVNDVVAFEQIVKGWKLKRIPRV